jgi:Sigma-70, region 4
MSRLDDLPPDQRAVLMLLVQQGKSHAEIADMLGISPDAVRDRAHAALSALADGPPAAGPAETSGSTHAPTRGIDDAQRTASSPSPRTSPAGARTVHSSTSLPVSRRGGALLLGLLVVAVIVAVILITAGGDSHKAASTAAGATTPAVTSIPSTSSTSKHAAGPTVDNQFALSSPEPASKTVGLVEVVSEGAKHAFYIAAEHLPPSQGFFYVVWLYNSPTNAVALGKSPSVNSNGRLQAGALLPANAGSYHKMLLTRETSSGATHPGQIVLSGTFAMTK